jgi:hypothetical protein
MKMTACRQCQNDYPEESKFCNQCGARWLGPADPHPEWNHPYPAWEVFSSHNQEWSCGLNIRGTSLDDVWAGLNRRQQQVHPDLRFRERDELAIAHVTACQFEPPHWLTYFVTEWRPVRVNADGSFTLEAEPSAAPRVVHTSTLE